MASPRLAKRTTIAAFVVALIAIPLSSRTSEAARGPSEGAVSPAAPGTCTPAEKCCRVCSAGKACGNSCIQATKVCHKGRGCASNEAEICSAE